MGGAVGAGGGVGFAGDVAGEDRAWDGEVAEEVEQAEEAGDGVKAGGPAVVAQAEGLEHALETVQEMETQERDRDGVGGGDDRVLEAIDDHRVDVVYIGSGGDDGEAEEVELARHRVVLERRLEVRVVGQADGEVEKVVNNEGENKETAPAHGARSEGGADGVFGTVADGAGFFVFKGERDRGPDVDDDAGKEEGADAPERRPERLEEVGVAVDLVGVREYLEIANQVAGHEADEDEAGEGHEDFAANGGAKEVTEEAHREKEEVIRVEGRPAEALTCTVHC